MELVKKNEKHRIYKKRSGRFGIQDEQKRWINGDKKIELLVQEGLIKVAPAKKAKEPEAEVKAE